MTADSATHESVIINNKPKRSSDVTGLTFEQTKLLSELAMPIANMATITTSIVPETNKDLLKNDVGDNKDENKKPQLRNETSAPNKQNTNKQINNNNNNNKEKNLKKSKEEKKNTTLPPKGMNTNKN